MFFNSFLGTTQRQRYEKISPSPYNELFLGEYYHHSPTRERGWVALIVKSRAVISVRLKTSFENSIRLQSSTVVRDSG